MRNLCVCWRDKKQWFFTYRTTRLLQKTAKTCIFDWFCMTFHSIIIANTHNAKKMNKNSKTHDLSFVLSNELMHFLVSVFAFITSAFRQGCEPTTKTMLSLHHVLQNLRNCGKRFVLFEKMWCKAYVFLKKSFFDVFHHFLERFDSKNITFFCTTRTKCMKLQNWWFKKHYVFQWKCTQLKNGFLIGANLFRLELLCVCKMASPIVVLYLFVKFMQIHSMFLVRFVAIHNFARNVTRFRICIRNFEWICKNNGHWFSASKFQKINNQQI